MEVFLGFAVSHPLSGGGWCISERRYFRRLPLGLGVQAFSTWLVGWVGGGWGPGDGGAVLGSLTGGGDTLVGLVPLRTSSGLPPGVPRFPCDPSLIFRLL